MGDIKVCINCLKEIKIGREYFCSMECERDFNEEAGEKELDVFLKEKYKLDDFKPNMLKEIENRKVEFDSLMSDLHKAQDLFEEAAFFIHKLKRMEALYKAYEKPLKTDINIANKAKEYFSRKLNQGAFDVRIDYSRMSKEEYAKLVGKKK